MSYLANKIVFLNAKPVYAYISKPNTGAQTGTPIENRFRIHAV